MEVRERKAKAIEETTAVKLIISCAAFVLARVADLLLAVFCLANKFLEERKEADTFLAIKWWSFKYFSFRAKQRASNKNILLQTFCCQFRVIHLRASVDRSDANLGM